MTEVAKFDEQKVGTIRLSEAIRECGYGHTGSYFDCLLARSYKRMTGRDLVADGTPHYLRGEEGAYVRIAAKGCGVSIETAREAERRCSRMDTPNEIAGWLEAQGL